jgi:hypothetical protein
VQRRLTAAHNIHPEHSVLDGGWKCRLKEQSRPPKVTYEYVVENETSLKVKGVRQILDLHGTKSHVASRKRKRGTKAKAAALATTTTSTTTGYKYPHKPLVESIRSPLGLLEELVAEDPWQLLLCTILLNRTSRCQVDHIFFMFLQRWSSPHQLLEKASLDDVATLLRPLGINNRRAHGIFMFSRDYLALLKDNKDMTSLLQADIQGLHNCGDYACDAYRIFVRRDLTVKSKDRALQTYVEYKSGLVRL